MRKWPIRRLLLILLLVWAGSALWQAHKPLPPGLSRSGVWRPAGEVAFLADLTYVDVRAQRHSEQAIFDAMLAMIAQAQRLIWLDMFLFNDFSTSADAALRPLSQELTQALLRRKAQLPQLRVVLITDPINRVYGGQRSAHLERLRAAGIEVVETDLAALRASNPLWSGPWALCCAWLGNDAEGGWLPNPFGRGRITLRSWLAVPNFRANHRKTLVTDSGSGWQALVTSANPHDASSAHGNVALRFSGAAARDLLDSEAAVAAFSGLDPGALPALLPEAPPSAGAARLRVLTEGAIADALLQTLAAARAGERLDVAVFYLSERRIVQALKAARARGVVLRVLLDPNEDAFGRKKNGIPNRQVAAELVEAGIALRWCDTHGEQCHAKLLLHHAAQGSRLILGSANFTRRNLADLNLESNVQFEAPPAHPAMAAAAQWFEQNWSNAGGRGFSTGYARYADDSILRRLWYRIGEASGLSTW